MQAGGRRQASLESSSGQISHGVALEKSRLEGADCTDSYAFKGSNRTLTPSKKSLPTGPRGEGAKKTD